MGYAPRLRFGLSIVCVRAENNPPAQRIRLETRGENVWKRAINGGQLSGGPPLSLNQGTGSEPASENAAGNDGREAHAPLYFHAKTAAITACLGIC
jgi:hypothetical protein